MHQPHERMDLALRRKWTLKAHGQQQVFLKRAQESTEHVLMKAGLWALYLPEYPTMQVEVSIGDRYKPDLIAMDTHEAAVFWGEAGKVTPAKVASLTRRYPTTTFALAKWAMRLAPVAAVYQKARDTRHQAPFCLISFPPNTADFIASDGTIAIPEGVIERVHL